MNDKKNNDSMPTTASDSPTNNAKLTENLNELSDADIASVMNPDRLNQLLTQADAFTRVNSEDLDDFQAVMNQYQSDFISRCRKTTAFRRWI